MKSAFHYLRPVLLTMLVVMFGLHSAFAQTEVRGVVTDASDHLLQGVSVQVKGTGKGTNTNAKGQYSINVSANATLEFSFVGFAPQEIAVANRSTINVQLQVNANALNEVVVTALGITKEVKRIGYSIQEVKGADLVKARESNPINSLVGKVAGLNVGVNQELLASPTVLLRGSPLNFFVVDGIPINSDTWNISPDDIESFTVLKGPTAAALYGSRGINGAILITTKRGSKSKKGFTVEFNSSNQINKGFIAIPKTQNMYGGGEKQQYAFGDYNSTGNSVDGINDEDYDVWGPQLDIGLMLPQFDGP